MMMGHCEPPPAARAARPLIAISMPSHSASVSSAGSSGPAAATSSLSSSDSPTRSSSSSRSSSHAADPPELRPPAAASSSAQLPAGPQLAAQPSADAHNTTGTIESVRRPFEHLLEYNKLQSFYLAALLYSVINISVILAGQRTSYANQTSDSYAAEPALCTNHPAILVIVTIPVATLLALLAALSMLEFSSAEHSSTGGATLAELDSSQQSLTNQRNNSISCSSAGVQLAAATLSITGKKVATTLALLLVVAPINLVYLTDILDHSCATTGTTGTTGTSLRSRLDSYLSVERMPIVPLLVCVYALPVVLRRSHLFNRFIFLVFVLPSTVTLIVLYIGSNFTNHATSDLNPSKLEKNLGFVSLACLLAAFLCGHLRDQVLHLVAERNIFSGAGDLIKDKVSLEQQRQQQETLLLSVLPAYVAEQVKRTMLRKMTKDSPDQSGAAAAKKHHHTTTITVNSESASYHEVFVPTQYSAVASLSGQRRASVAHQLASSPVNVLNPTESGAKSPSSSAFLSSVFSARLSTGTRSALELGATGNANSNNHAANQLSINARRGFNQLYIRTYNNVSLLYGDIVGFTRLCSHLSSSQLVRVLNNLFSHFDYLAEYHKIMRIKILGDCYYGISGIPEFAVLGAKSRTKCNDNHATNCVNMGLDMIRYIKRLNIEHLLNLSGSPTVVADETGGANDANNRFKFELNMRIGIHTGHVHSGVIGQKKWQFDVWSNDVSIAMHCESSGVAGRVQVTETTAGYLHGEFELEPVRVSNGTSYLADKNIKTFLISEQSARNIGSNSISRPMKMQQFPMDTNGSIDGASGGSKGVQVTVHEDESCSRSSSKMKSVNLNDGCVRDDDERKIRDATIGTIRQTLLSGENVNSCATNAYALGLKHNDMSATFLQFNDANIETNFARRQVRLLIIWRELLSIFILCVVGLQIILTYNLLNIESIRTTVIFVSILEATLMLIICLSTISGAEDGPKCHKPPPGNYRSSSNRDTQQRTRSDSLNFTPTATCMSDTSPSRLTSSILRIASNKWQGLCNSANNILDYCLSCWHRTDEVKSIRLNKLMIYGNAAILVTTIVTVLVYYAIMSNEIKQNCRVDKRIGYSWAREIVRTVESLDISLRFFRRLAVILIIMAIDLCTNTLAYRFKTTVILGIVLIQAVVLSTSELNLDFDHMRKIQVATQDLIPTLICKPYVKQLMRSTPIEVDGESPLAVPSKLPFSPEKASSEQHSEQRRRRDHVQHARSSWVLHSEHGQTRDEEYHRHEDKVLQDIKNERIIIFSADVLLIILALWSLAYIRQIEYSNRANFLWRNRLNVDHEELEYISGINKILLENILPSHVVQHYLNNKQHVTSPLRTKISRPRTNSRSCKEELRCTSKKKKMMKGQATQQTNLADELSSGDEYAHEKMDRVNKLILQPNSYFSQDDELYHEQHDGVAVMFASIPHFYEFYDESDLSKQGLGCIALLNEIICDFDQLLTKNKFSRIEKIKTIGSSYMAAAGLRPSNKDLRRGKQQTIGERNPSEGTTTGANNNNEVQQTVRQFARASQSSQFSLASSIGSVKRKQSDLQLQPNPSDGNNKRLISINQQKMNLICMIQFAASLMTTLNGINKQSFQVFKLRVGVNSGSVIAGIIGCQRPFYDIWGDCVNIASRMESLGEVGRIQVEESTAKLLQECLCPNSYSIERRGPIDVKGKGGMVTYFVDCKKKPQLSYSPSPVQTATSDKARGSQRSMSEGCDEREEPQNLD